MTDPIDPSDPGRPGIARALAVMARLRHPDRGCPWDLEQTFASIVPHTIEEAYEVADAIARDHPADLKDELGDLLFQTLFYARLAEERDLFDFNDVAAGLADKMIRRHPHVFGDDVVTSAGEMTGRWEEHKDAERTARKDADQIASALDGVIVALPALTRAVKLQKRAARVGFDWPDASQVLDKIEEEVGELRAVLADGGDRHRRLDELGDLLFAVTNLARRLDIDPEDATRHTNAKFERRFRQMERWLHQDGRTAADLSLQDLEDLWQRAKKTELDQPVEAERSHLA